MSLALSLPLPAPTGPPSPGLFSCPSTEPSYSPFGQVKGKTPVSCLRVWLGFPQLELGLSPTGFWGGWVFLTETLFCRIPQQIRISGSLVAIGLVFLVTAIMVKVPMEPLPFFVFTMISIVFINCE